jgi:hypothetical protein
MILLAAMPVLLYLELCRGLGFHYGSRARAYEDAAQQLSTQLINAGDFSDKGRCEVDRYFGASSSAIDQMGFNAIHMIARWNEDFLREQKPCM